jgi:hypothetical protein
MPHERISAKRSGLAPRELLFPRKGAPHGVPLLLRLWNACFHSNLHEATLSSAIDLLLADSVEATDIVPSALVSCHGDSDQHERIDGRNSAYQFDFPGVLVIVADIERITNHLRQMRQALRIFYRVSPRSMHLGGTRKDDMTGLQLSAYRPVDCVSRQRSKHKLGLPACPLAHFWFSGLIDGGVSCIV